MGETRVDIAERFVDGCVVLDIDAPNFTYPQTSALKNYIIALLAQGRRYFVINAHNIVQVDSYGLATIVSTLKIVRDHHGALALYGLNDLFTHLVELTHLDRVLEVWPSEAQATYYLTSMMKDHSHSS